MGALAPMFNMAVVDTVRNITHPSWNTVKDVGLKLTAVSMSIALAAVMKDWFNRRLPSGRELPNGEVEDWGKWFEETFTDNFFNLIPIANKFIDFVRQAQGRRASRTESQLLEPASRIYRGIKNWGDEEKGAEAVENVIHGLVLLGVPIPYNGIRQWLRFIGAVKD